MPAVRSPGRNVMTPAFQAGNAGFKSRRSYCGYRITEVKRTQFAMQICGSVPTEAERRPTPPGHIMDGYA